MKKSRIIFFILVIAIGIFVFIYGGIDDSPGGQLIGLIMVIVGIVVLIKNKSYERI